MRKESCPSISSRSAVSKRMLAIALLSTHLKINQTEVEESFAHTPACCCRELSDRHYSKGTGDERQTRAENIDWRACPVLLSFHNICRLRAFLALGDLELNLIAFLQALVALGGDRAVVHKHIGPIRATNEPVSFRVIEPLYGSFHTFHKEPLFCTSS